MGGGVVAGTDRARYAEELLHDMRSPLGVIRGQCHGIVRCAGQPEALIDRLRIIDGEIDRVVTAIDRVRSALCGIACEEPPGPVDLVVIAREAVRRHEGSAAERGIALTAEALTDHAEVTGSADELRRLVDNLVSNAIRHAPHGTGVRLAISDEGRNVTLRVSDRGAGIDVRASATVFDRHPARRGTHGWGIGLVIAGEIAARHNGRIALDPEVPGATLQVELPAAGHTSVAR
jgi:signal transduction histidine kinase